MYEGPVYPSTLTYYGVVPNIELVRQGAGTAIRKESRAIPGRRISVPRACFDDLVSGSGEPQVRQMFMRSLETNAKHRRHWESGFSLIEMMVVVVISMIITAVAIVSFVPAMKSQHVTNAYNTTLAAMRQARDAAVAQRTSYSVTFANNTGAASTIVVAPALYTGVSSWQGEMPTFNYQLPLDVTFQTNSAISATSPPDSGAGACFGSGANAIDFGWTAANSSCTTGGGQSVVYFCPDGSAQTASCNETVNGIVYSTAGGYSVNWDDGVVYIARTGDLLSSRAITLWGGTGRIHGWRLYPNGGGYQWVRQ